MTLMMIFHLNHHIEIPVTVRRLDDGKPLPWLAALRQP